jgi:hypothetical protein
MRRPTTRITANFFMGRFVKRKFPIRQRLWRDLIGKACEQPVIKPQPLSWDQQGNRRRISVRILL